MSWLPSPRQKHDSLTGSDVRIVRDSKSATLFALALALVVFVCVPVSAGQKPAAKTAEATAKPLIAKSADGTKIVSDVTGTGTGLMLLHGGGQTRKSWSDRGYVERLSKRFRVIAVDLRGSGESDKPATPAAYELDRVLADLLAVADAAGVKRFHVWGFGHGATIGRYLAARSDRVMSMVMVGADMGPAVSGIVKDALTGMRAKWQPLLDAQKAGTFDVKTLSPGDRAAWDGGIATSSLALWALLDYPPLEPADIKVPTLWVVGSADQTAMANVKEYEAKLAGTQVKLETLSGASYSDSFAKIDVVLEQVEPFLASVAEKS
jgi:pimeloyl-ACP methyl ester carboxylesterase